MAEIETSEVNVDAILDPQDIRVSIEDVIVIKGQDADIAAAEAATSAANEAAINANQAGANANEAAKSANNAATNANESATNADTAATNANAAATEVHGAAANANEAAANANETANQIKQRAEAGEFNGEPGADGYSPTANVTKVGGTATITVTDKNGTTTATVSDGAPGSDAQSTDVRVKGISITENGIANIPPASYDKLGVVMNGAGIDISTSGVINPKPLMQNMITNRKAGFTYNNNSNDRCAITPSRLDYAFKAAMCDGKGAAWTNAEKLAARKRIGLEGALEITSLTLDKEASYITLSFPKPKAYASVIVEHYIPQKSIDNIPTECPFFATISDESGSSISELYAWYRIPKLSETGATGLGFLQNNNGIWTWLVKSAQENAYYNSMAFITSIPSYRPIENQLVKNKPCVKNFTIGTNTLPFPVGTRLTAYGILAGGN